MITTRKDHLVLCGQNNTKWAQRGYNHQSEMCERLEVEASQLSFKMISVLAIIGSKCHQLKEHFLTHSGEQPNKCTQCNYASSRASALKFHMKMHSLEKPNQCKWCDYLSITKSGLIKHLLTHSGEKTHHCKECGSLLGLAETLKVHNLRLFLLKKKQRKCIKSVDCFQNLTDCVKF